MPGILKIRDEIEVKQNLIITARERGKIVARREGHNIWVNLGREYLASLIAYSALDPDVPEEDNRIKYMGFGVGGDRQIALAVANAAPIITAYPGTNIQSDTDPTITALERPVRVAGSTTGPADPYLPTDQWIGTIQAPATHSPATSTLFRRLFLAAEISYSTFTSVPLSEVGLYTAAAALTGQPFNTLVAYDTFDTISKTSAVEIEVQWTIRF